MRKIVTLLLTCIAGIFSLHAQSFTHPFEILVKEGATEVSFELGGKASVAIDWGDGTTETIEVDADATQTIEHIYATPLAKNSIVTFEAKGIERFKNRFKESGSIIGVGKVDAPDLLSFYYMSYKGGTLTQSTDGVVDLSRCSKLKYISIQDAPRLKIGYHPQLKYIMIQSSRKKDSPAYATLANTDLDLSRYPEMEYVWVTDQKEIKEINLTGLTKLNFFRWQNGGIQNAIGLREITLHNEGLKRLNISGHQLPLSSLPAKNPDFEYDEYVLTYAPEGYAIPEENIVGTSIDLTQMATEYDFAGQPQHPNIIWKEASSGEVISADHYTLKDGIFRFKESLFADKESITLQATFEPAFFSLKELTGSETTPLKSNEVTLHKSDIQNEEVNIALKTDLPIGAQIAINLGDSKGVVLTGVKEAYQQGDYEEGRYLYTITSQSISISGDITELDCNGQQLTAAHLKDLPNLSYVELHTNKLAQFTIQNCPAVEELYIGKNQLERLDLSHQKELTTLDCSGNGLLSLQLDDCPALSSLWCYRNRLSTLDVSAFPALSELMAYANRLTSLDLANNPKLKTLNVADNQLQELDFTATPLLMTVVCHTNAIRGEKMTSMMQSLPQREANDKGKITIVDTNANNEENLCLVSDVAIAKDKNWTCYDFRGSIGNTEEYEGDTTAIDNVLASNPSIVIYPNPATDFVYIRTSDDAVWALYSLTGELQLTGSGTVVDLRSLAQGDYLLVIEHNSLRESLPLFKR